MEENKEIIIEKGTEQEKHNKRMKHFYDLFNQIKEEDPNFNIMVLSTTKDSTGKELGASFMIGDADKLGVEFRDCILMHESFRGLFWKVWRYLYNSFKCQRRKG